jgi:phosphoglycerate dehydrogenase-like enzyme
MKLAITSPSFSKNPVLVAEARKLVADCKVNEKGILFSGQELIDYLKGYDVAIIGLEEVNKEVVDALPELKFISKYGVGLNNIDLDYCKKAGIQIGWTGGVNRLSVAEMVVGNVISLFRNLYVTSNLLKKGEWLKNGGRQLSGTTVGIIGVGHIGKELIRLLKPFDCKILVNDIIDQSEYYKQACATEVSKEEIFTKADWVTVHAPLDSSTRNMVNEKMLSLMQPHALLVNAARGGIVDEVALKNALKNGKIGGAFLDVYDIEPPTDKELLAIPNLICTPHIGGNSKEAVMLMGMSAVGHLKMYVEGK